MGARWLSKMSSEERERIAAERRDAALRRGREHYARNRMAQRERGRLKYLRTGEKQREHARQQYAANPLAERARKLFQKYALTLTGWLAMFWLQGERCACCAATEPDSRFGWHVDHEHDTVPVKVRGIVCDRCNRTVAMLGDTLERAEMETQMYLNYLARAA